MIFALATLIALPMFAAKVKHAAVFDDPETYSSVLINVGTSGTKNIKVSGTGKNKDAAMERAAMNAIHSVIFSGIAAATNGESTPKLYKSSEPSVEDQEYFDNFFNNGDYKRFLVQVASPAGKDMSEIKGGIKVKVEIQVKFDELRDKLIQDNIIQGLADAIEGVTKPTLIIFPSEKWCHKNNCMTDDAPDYKKALMDDNMVDMIAEFEKFMAAQGYKMPNLKQAVDKYYKRKALEKADAMDGHSIEKSARDKIAAAVSSDMRIEFDYEIRTANGKQFVHFTIGVYDCYTSKTVYSNPADGTPVYGNAQMTNQLKEAILNIKDEFLGAIQKEFNTMATEGREIIIHCVKDANCEITYNKKFDGTTLTSYIRDYLDSEIMPNSSYSTTNATGSNLEFEQVHIPLFKETVNKRTGKVTRSAQYAVDFGQGLAEYITEISGQPCAVVLEGAGEVTLYLGRNDDEDDE